MGPGETLALTPALSPRRGGSAHSSREFSRPLVRYCFMGTYVDCYFFNQRSRGRPTMKVANPAAPKIRPPACAGRFYPADSAQLRKLVQGLLGGATTAGGSERRGDVVGRLAVRNRSKAERDLASLLAKTGGATLSRQRGPAITVVKGVLPGPSYGAFAAGLRDIGSWQLEIERSPLPILLNVTVKLAE